LSLSPSFALMLLPVRSPPAYHQQQWLRKEIKLKKFTWRLIR
jgi:hypothetical protein